MRSTAGALVWWVTFLGEMGFSLAAAGSAEDAGGGWTASPEVLGHLRFHQKISSTSGGFTGALADLDFFGFKVAGLGDVDGDGNVDLAAGAPFDSQAGPVRGEVWILFLHPNGTVKAHQKINDVEGGFTGTLDDGDGFGSSVAALGDLDADGVTELVVGADADSDAGPNRGAAVEVPPNGRLYSANWYTWDNSAGDDLTLEVRVRRRSSTDSALTARYRAKEAVCERLHSLQRS